MNKEKLYRFIWDNRNHNNEFIYTQLQVSEITGIGNRTISEYFNEFIKLGLMEESSHKFIPLYHPDKIPWTKYIERLRAYHQYNRRNNLTRMGNPRSR